MESAKIPHHHHRHHHHHHHHQNQQQLPLQDQLVVSSTTLEYAPGYAAPTAHAWTSNSTALNINGSFDSSANAAIIHSRNPRFQHDILVSSLNGSLTHQDLSFNWDNSAGNNYTNIQSSHESQLSRFKRELSNSCPNLSEMIRSPSSSIEDVQQLDPPSYGKTDPNVKLLISTVSPGGQSNGFPSCPEEFYCATSSSLSLAATPKRRTSSQIYPTINVSNISQTSLANSSSFDMNLQALDLLHSARFNGDFRQSLQDQLVISRNALSNYGFDYVRQSIPMPSESSNTTPFSNGVVAEEKSCNTKFEAKVPQAAAQKRSRVDPRPSCQPLKVRKEKLGDRIAALQQLVAPFGKTDTATVLMEAIGYIKFLQNQVETLSVPYLKSSRSNNSRAMHGVRGPAENGSDQERKRDLKSRGLCLVPTSCLSYMTDTGGSVWPPPPTYGGATS